MNAIIESNWLLTHNNLYFKIWEFLNTEGLLVNIKWKLYPNRTWFRKLAMFLWINIQVMKETRVQVDKYFVYDFTVRASSKDGRFTECSASCASNEREFNHLENDVRATAQTRATNRAISDFMWITDLTNYIKDFTWTNSWESEIISNKTYTNNTDISNNITNKQKEFLIKLIIEVFEDEDEQKSYIETLDELTRREANFHIKQLLEEKNTKTS